MPLESQAEVLPREIHEEARLVIPVELAAAAGAKTAVGREAWKLYGQAREAGLGRLDSSGLLGLLEPPKP